MVGCRELGEGWFYTNLHELFFIRGSYLHESYYNSHEVPT